MNKERRKRITKILSALDSALSSAIEDLGYIRDEEQDYLDNMPQSIAEGDKGTTVQEGIEKLEDFISSLETAQSEAGEVEDLLCNS